MNSNLRAPFPYFGGKSKIAATIWDYLGDVNNYIEPFCGSLAVLLARPTGPGTETVNDIDGLLVNAWRSILWDPDETAKWADWPVTEIDYNSRHKWLRDNRQRITQELIADPLYRDCQAAGWWIWGANLHIGGAWCYCEYKKLPHLGDPGTGVNKLNLPHLGDPGTGVKLQPWFRAIAQRLRRTRIICGEWNRCLSPSVTTKHGLTGVFLDPPYKDNHADIYSTENDVYDSVVDWCRENGENPLFRIILCGYSDNSVNLKGWREVHWKANKGYQKSENGMHSGQKEIMYLSPHCRQVGLFDSAVNS